MRAHFGRALGRAAMIAACALAVTARAQSVPAPPQTAGAASPQPAGAASPQPAGAASPQPVLLDRVVAIINGDVLLQSDVEEELQMDAIQPFRINQQADTLRAAASRLVDRILIQQQIRDQRAEITVTDEQLLQALNEVKKRVPACIRYQCTTDAGWKNFLADNRLNETDVENRLRVRITLTRFIDTRFRAGIHISRAEIEDYYKTTFVPLFQKQNVKPPPLDSVSSRVEEVLLEQHVSVLLQDWLKSLREQGSVQILDDAYTELPNENGGGA